MTKQCSYGGCKNLALTNTYRCEKHKVTYSPKKRYEHHYHQGKHIYSSARWTKFSKQYRKHHPLCAHCEARGIFTPVYLVDHIIEIADGGEIWDVDNVEGLCVPCHNSKTGAEKKKRNRRKKNNGFGLISDY